MSTQNTTESELVFQVLYRDGQVRLQVPFIGRVFSDANAAMRAVLADDVEDELCAVQQTAEKVVFFRGWSGLKVVVLVDGENELEIVDIGAPEEYGVRLLNRSDPGACLEDGRHRRRPTTPEKLAGWKQALLAQAAPVVY